MAEPTTSDASINWGHTLRRDGPGTSAAVPAVMPTGNTRYETTGVIGEGGMGRVVQATDKQFSRVVAIKELRHDRADAASRERFELEALVTGNLEHPGIPAVYERGHNPDSSPFYVMRRVLGLTLDEALKEAGDSLAERLKLLPVVMKAAQTVGFAHAQGVVHRDLKPQNIIVGKHGEVVVVDWGLAKVRGMVLHTTSGEHLIGSGGGAETVAGSVMGTPAYMAARAGAGKARPHRRTHRRVRAGRGAVPGAHRSAAVHGADYVRAGRRRRARAAPPDFRQGAQGAAGDLPEGDGEGGR